MSTYRPFASGAEVAVRAGLPPRGVQSGFNRGQYVLYQVVAGGDRQAPPGLVRSIDKRDENQLFVQSLTGACAGTHAQVFAASVRTRNEWQTLKERGIHGGQGDFSHRRNRSTWGVKIFTSLSCLS